MYKDRWGMYVDFRLGDALKAALDAIGITHERVERWVGAPCGCKERQEKMNRLGAWVKRVLGGKTEKAKEYLEEIVSERGASNSDTERS
jgi:hypothetical protein